MSSVNVVDIRTAIKKGSLAIVWLRSLAIEILFSLCHGTCGYPYKIILC